MLCRPAAVCLIAVLAAVASADEMLVTLKVGDPAPPLKTGDWVKGPPVKAVEPGTIYIVEFWSTSCAWCVPAMVHLTDLARKHPDMVFIGQDIFEDDDAAVKPFLAKVGDDKIGYRIALDDKSKIPDGEMNTTWFAAAGYDAMPATIVVGRDGKIAWTGRPADLDPVLEQLAAGTFDPKAVADTQAKVAVLERDLAKAVRGGDLDAALKASQGLRAAKPAEADRLAAFDVNLLYRNGRPDAARKAAGALVASSKEPKALSTMAWNVASLDSPMPDDLKLARQAADRAMQLSEGKDGNAFDASARLHALAGEWDQAVADQKQGVDLAIGDDNRSLARTALDAYARHELPALK